MKTIYIDDDYRCHMENGGSMRSVETDFFEGKCTAFVEGYRFVPEGESWTRDDGTVFTGEMVAPAEDYDALDKAQTQYEQDEASHLAELGALIEEIYNEDMEVIDNV